jgi:thioredoxin 1
MNTKQTTAEHFERDVLGSGKPVLVDFWAPWCAPCLSLAPCLDAIAGEHPEKLAVYKVNVDQCIGLAQRYGVSSIPELKVFVDGKVVKSFGGAMSKRSLEVQLARWLW